MQAASDQALNAACEADGGLIRDHMSTANVARDLDMLRQMVGDEGLTFAGYSYGSFLGVTYANMFPDRVRAVVVDGVLDPVAWTTGTGNADTLPFSTRLRSDAGSPSHPRRVLPTLRSGRSGSLRTGGRFGGPFRRPCRTAVRRTARHHRSGLRRVLHADLRRADRHRSGSSLRLGELAVHGLPAGGSSRRRFRATELGVTYDAALAATGLAEPLSRYPNRSRVSSALHAPTATTRPIIPSGRRPVPRRTSNTATSGDCGPGHLRRVPHGRDTMDDRFVGPFDASTANKVLVVGTRYDPATRYEGAEAVRALLPNSSLLTVEGWGHTSLFLSRCADRVVLAIPAHRPGPRRCGVQPGLRSLPRRPGVRGRRRAAGTSRGPQRGHVRGGSLSWEVEGTDAIVTGELRRPAQSPRDRARRSG